MAAYSKWPESTLYVFWWNARGTPFNKDTEVLAVLGDHPNDEKDEKGVAMRLYDYKDIVLHPDQILYDVAFAMKTNNDDLDRLAIILPLFLQDVDDYYEEQRSKDGKINKGR